jgi:membrane-anchored protein YejM (alkaline phosphatase superfamily)
MKRQDNHLANETSLLVNPCKATKLIEALPFFFLISYFTIIWNVSLNVDLGEISDPIALGYIVLVILTYSFFYLLPVLLPVLIFSAVLKHSKFIQARPQLKTFLLKSTEFFTFIGVTLVHVSLFADRQLFSIFGFHVNGFVLNLLSTDGGIESMGGSGSAGYVYALYILGFLLAEMAIFYSAWKLRFSVKRKTVYVLVALLVFLSVSERLTYAVSRLENFNPVLSASSSFPLYVTTTITSIAKRFGVKPERTPQLEEKNKGFDLDYPLSPLKIVKPEKPYNIVWLTSESLRADMLTPEIMPKTSEFGKTAHTFENHFSGGNGTRMAMFSMFYGLYGSYWFSFLEAQRAPVIMEVLEQQNYQFGMYTSAQFTYPEFNRTVFANIPTAELKSDDAGEGWERDRRNVGRVIDFLDNRDKSRPFMTFMFFESPHARYFFPEETVIRKDYLPDLNYATMDVERDMPLIKNRYINSVHHLDQQLDRVLTYLKDNELLETTIVVVTGDHGEEFMEHGRWGHNSQFTDEQIKTPLVLWIPGTGSSVTNRMTSHLDLAPTIVPLLGVKNPETDYSLGFNLLNGKERTSTVIADWSRVVYVDSKYKAVFDLTNTSYTKNPLTDANDTPIKDSKPFYQSHKKNLAVLMKELGKYRRKDK